MIFALAMEPLACRLRLQAQDWGIKISNEHHIVSLYGDDALIYLREPYETLPDLMSILNVFGTMSGLSVHWAKSCIYLLRYLPQPARNPTPIAQLNWEFDTFRYLGIQVFHSEANLLEAKVYKAMRSIRGSMRFWSSLPLSPIGRVSISKMLILP